MAIHATQFPPTPINPAGQVPTQAVPLRYGVGSATQLKQVVTAPKHVAHGGVHDAQIVTPSIVIPTYPPGQVV